MSDSVILTWLSNGGGSEIGGSISGRPTGSPARIGYIHHLRAKTICSDNFSEGNTC